MEILDAFTFACLVLPIVAFLIAWNSYQYICRGQGSRDRIRAKLDLYAMSMKLFFVFMAAFGVLILIYEANEHQYDRIRNDAISHALFVLNFHYQRIEESDKIGPKDRNLLKSCITSARDELVLGVTKKDDSMLGTINSYESCLNRVSWIDSVTRNKLGVVFINLYLDKPPLFVSWFRRLRSPDSSLGAFVLAILGISMMIAGGLELGLKCEQSRHVSIASRGKKSA